MLRVCREGGKDVPAPPSLPLCLGRGRFPPVLSRPPLTAVCATRPSVAVGTNLSALLARTTLWSYHATLPSMLDLVARETPQTKTQPLPALRQKKTERNEACPSYELCNILKVLVLLLMLKPRHRFSEKSRPKIRPSCPCKPCGIGVWCPRNSNVAKNQMQRKETRPPCVPHILDIFWEV